MYYVRECVSGIKRRKEQPRDNLIQHAQTQYTHEISASENASVTAGWMAYLQRNIPTLGSES